MAKKTKAGSEHVGADTPVEPLVTKVYRVRLPLRQMVIRPDWTDRGDTPIDPPRNEITLSFTATQRVFRPDFTNSGDTPVKPPKPPYGGEGYLPALRELVDRIVERYGGTDAFERFVNSHLDGLPADAAVAITVKGELQRLQNAIIANDVFGAISATVAIERALASPWTGFNRSTGYKSAQARKQNGAAVKRAEFDAIKREVERLQQENPHLSRTAAIERAAKKAGRSPGWFYRWKKSFGDP